MTDFYIKGQRVRKRQGDQQVGTIIGRSTGPRVKNGVAYRVLWDGAKRTGNWHSSLLIEATDANGEELPRSGLDAEETK